jgi:Protein of unknown function (DUF4225)
MEQINNKLKPSSDDYFRVTNAAGVLASQACTVSAKHIQDGMLRIQFNREVAYYARGIVRDVAEGKRSTEEGLKELIKELKSIASQSIRYGSQGMGIAAGGLQVIGGAAICRVGQMSRIARAQACAVGALITAHGVNNVIENGINLWTGRSDTVGPTRKTYQNVAKATGRSEFEGNMAYAGMDIGLSVWGLYKLTLKPDSWRLFRYIDADYIRAYRITPAWILGIDGAADTTTAFGAWDEWRKRP